jgi:hypothetical protein
VGIDFWKEERDRQESCPRRQEEQEKTDRQEEITVQVLPIWIPGRIREDQHSYEADPSHPRFQGRNFHFQIDVESRFGMRKLRLLSIKNASSPFSRVSQVLKE